MNAPKVAKMLARLMSGGFMVLGLAGFVPNPLIGAEGMLQADAFLNVFHILLGVMLLGFTTKGESTAAAGLYTVAMLEFFVAVLGYVGLGDAAVTKLFDVVTFSQQNVYLAAGSGVLLVICGMLNTSSKQLIKD
jgi:hypothetical protein